MELDFGLIRILLELHWKLLGRVPTHPTLLADLDAGFYFNR